MIDTHKNEIRYQVQHELYYVNKYVKKNPTGADLIDRRETCLTK